MISNLILYPVDLLAVLYELVFDHVDTSFDFNQRSGCGKVQFVDAFVQAHARLIGALVDVCDRGFQGGERGPGLGVFQLSFKIRDARNMKVVVRLDDLREFGDTGERLLEVPGEFIELTSLSETSVFHQRDASVEPIDGRDHGRCDRFVGLHQAVCKLVESCRRRDDRQLHFGNSVVNACVDARIKRRFENKLFEGAQSGTNQIELRSYLEDPAIGGRPNRVQGDRPGNGLGHGGVGGKFRPIVVCRRSGGGVVTHGIPRDG